MRLAWLTDIHLDFVGTPEIIALGAQICATGCEAAVITGDIAVAESLESKLSTLASASRCPIYFVLGNHDYYGASIDEVRGTARSFANPLVWLPARGPVALSERTWLVGCDGWGDARLGAPETSSVVLSDFFLIRDLREPGPAGLLARLRELGEAEGATMRALLERVPSSARRIIVATHVPPFREACWHEGRISDDDWLPFFTCDSVGGVLRSYADLHTTEILVLCGHTHGAGTVKIRPNLEVRTGGAEYGAPAIAGIVSVD